MRPHLELLIEDLLVLVLNQVFVSFFVLLNDLQSFRLHGPLKELFKTVVIHFVLLKIDREVPVDDI